MTIQNKNDEYNYKKYKIGRSLTDTIDLWSVTRHNSTIFNLFPSLINYASVI